jgi:putative nucleotide binding protein
MDNNSPKKEDEAIILDYLSLGYVKPDMTSFKGNAIAQAIGTQRFNLLELSPKKGVDLEILERVYIGKGKRDRISSVKRKLNYDDLTATSRIEIDFAIKEIIESQEEKYVNFFNEAGPISTRLHKLELIPGIGKKHREELLKARNEKPFESFEDIKTRVPLLSNPIEMLANRIKLELDNSKVKRGKNKYYLFTQIPSKGNNKKRHNHRNRRYNK